MRKPNSDIPLNTLFVLTINHCNGTEWKVGEMFIVRSKGNDSLSTKYARKTRGDSVGNSSMYLYPYQRLGDIARFAYKNEGKVFRKNLKELDILCM